MLDKIQFISANEIKRMLDELSQEELEQILKEKFNSLSEDAKKRILDRESGMNIVTGSFVALNSQVAVNIQNSPDFDPEALFKALAEYHKSKKNNP